MVRAALLPLPVASKEKLVRRGGEMKGRFRIPFSHDGPPGPHGEDTGEFGTLSTLRRIAFNQSRKASCRNGTATIAIETAESRCDYILKHLVCTYVDRILKGMNQNVPLSPFYKTPGMGGSPRTTAKKRTKVEHKFVVVFLNLDDTTARPGRRMSAP